MLALAGVLCLVCLVAGDQVININEEMDRRYKEENEQATKAHGAIGPIKALDILNVSLSDGWAVGLNTQYRTKDCTRTISSDNKTVTTDIHYGYRFFVVIYGSIKKNGLEYSGVYRIGKISAHTAFTVHQEPKCHVTVGAYEMEELDDVTVQTSIKPEATDMSEYFRKTVRPALNMHFSESIPYLEEHLTQCHCRPKPVHVDFPQLSNILNKFSLFHEY